MQDRSTKAMKRGVRYKPKGNTSILFKRLRGAGVRVTRMAIDGGIRR